MLSLYYNDIEEGVVYTSPSRTIAEYDLYLFAGMTGDMTEFHLSETAAADTHFGKRVAHGMLIVSIANGLYNRIGVTDTTGLGLMGVEWRFTAPVFISDAIRLKISAGRKRFLEGKKGGLVFWAASVVNQSDVEVGRGEFVRMVAYEK